MAINARTFEILYIVRQRAVLDLPTKLDDFSEFIAARRKDAPDIYHRAYIAPSALAPLLHRMTTGEGVLTLGTNGEYELTPRGSQMADLLVGLDACSSGFLDNYKEAIGLAVLQQRQRLGQGPVNPREVSAIANISLDSARRGLTILAEHNKIVEDRTSRTPTYTMPEPVVPADDADEDMPMATDRINDGGVTEADIEEAARLPLDDEEDPIASALRDLENEDDSWATAGPPPPPADEDEELELPLALGQILADDGPDDDEPAPPPPSNDPFAFVPPRDTEEPEDLTKADPYAWEDVPEEMLEGFVLRAKAAGMTLAEFLDGLNQLHEAQVRAALFGEIPMI